MSERLFSKFKKNAFSKLNLSQIITFLRSQRFVPYSWLVEQRAGNDTRILLQITEGSNIVVDELVNDVGGLKGGRLGVYTHSQANVIWSKLETECL